MSELVLVFLSDEDLLSLTDVEISAKTEVLGLKMGCRML